MIDGHRPGEAREHGGEQSAAEERNQAADERDLAADVRDVAAGQRDQTGDQRDRAADLRDSEAKQRDQTGDQRDRVADQRDQTSDQRDLAANDRDSAARRHDEAAEARDRIASHLGALTDATTIAVTGQPAVARRDAAVDRARARQDRQAGAGDRSHAEQDRDLALTDRDLGAGERNHAELDRKRALDDREASARDRRHASFDDLTGAYLRGVGFVQLGREIARARRTEQPLVLAFVDVDRLKDVNDSRGHAAGDRMLLEVATILRAKLRSYDLIIRYGGDEFVCVIPGLNVADATTRLALVNSSLAEGSEHGSVTVGFAELQPDDSLEALVARADTALYRQRRPRRRPRP